MIQNPFLIVFILLLIEIFILYVSHHRDFKRYFQFLPPVFWIYFLPMVATTSGLIDPQCAIYQTIIAHLLPASLFLLLITVDIKAILRLGAPALLMFFAGSAGIILGTIVTFFIFKNWVGSEFWSGFGALAASWTGGSANMIAVKEAVGTPEHIFAPMVVVDTIVPYVWMGLLVASVSHQSFFDRINRSDRRVLDDLTHRVAVDAGEKKKQLRWHKIILILALGAAGSFLAQSIAKFLPVIKDVVSTYAWTIILVSLTGITLSLTPLKRIEAYGSSRIGYFLLYFVLTCIGARASLANISSTALLILAGFMIVIIHAAVLLLAARIIKAPLFLVVSASQANIGGVASAPVVAEIYQPGLASVGLLLAILGNIIGTYLGILTAHLCRWSGSV